MFPRTSFVMMLIAGLLLLIASLVNWLSGNEINLIYLAVGVLFTLGGIGFLFAKKK